MDKLGKWLEMELNRRQLTQGQVAMYADGPDTAGLQAQIGESERAIDAIHAERAQLLRGYTKRVVDDDLYRKQDDAFKADIDAHEQRIADLQRQIAAVPDLAHWRRQMESLADDFELMIEELEPEVVAAELQRAGLRVEVEENQVVSVSWRV